MRLRPASPALAMVGIGEGVGSRKGATEPTPDVRTCDSSVEPRIGHDGEVVATQPNGLDTADRLDTGVRIDTGDRLDTGVRIDPSAGEVVRVDRGRGRNRRDARAPDAYRGPIMWI